MKPPNGGHNSDCQHAVQNAEFKIAVQETKFTDDSKTNAGRRAQLQFWLSFW